MRCNVFLSRDVAFWRKTLWEALSVCAIIVNHVVLLHPLQPLMACSVQFLWKPWTTATGGCRRSFSARRCSRRPYASLSIEVSVGSCEWSLCPICLHKSTSCCPVISIPQTRIYPHWLILWEGNPNSLRVLELSNGSAINWESELKRVWETMLRIIG